MSDLNCHRCRGWQKCLLNHLVISEDNDEWFSFGEWRWCPFQVLWVLKFRDLFNAGKWPPEHKETIMSGQLSREGSFVKPALVIAELEVRLKRTGKQAELLTSQVEDGREFHNLTSGAREVLMYVKGYRRKTIGFRRWLREVFYCQKGGKKEQGKA